VSTADVTIQAACLTEEEEEEAKAIPLQAWTGPQGSRKVPRFQNSRHMKVVRFSALLTVPLYPQEMFLVLISVRG